jgi:hypothetical protein
MFEALKDVAANIFASLVSERGGDMIGVITILVIGLITLIRWHRRQQRQGKRGIEVQHVLTAGIVGLWLSLSCVLAVAGWMVWNGQGLTIGSVSRDIFTKLNLSDFRPISYSFDPATQKLGMTYVTTVENGSDETIYFQSRSGGIQIQGRVNQDENPVSVVAAIGPKQRRDFTFATIEGIDASDPKTRIPGKIKLEIAYGPTKEQLNYIVIYEGEIQIVLQVNAQGQTTGAQSAVFLKRYDHGKIQSQTTF